MAANRGAIGGNSGGVMAAANRASAAAMAAWRHGVSNGGSGNGKWHKKSGSVSNMKAENESAQWHQRSA